MSFFSQNIYTVSFSIKNLPCFKIRVIIAREALGSVKSLRKFIALSALMLNILFAILALSLKTAEFSFSRYQVSGCLSPIQLVLSACL